MSIPHSYIAVLKQDGNKTHFAENFPLPAAARKRRGEGLSEKELHRKKYSLGSADPSTTQREDFEEILRYLENKTSEELYENCVDMVSEESGIQDDEEKKNCRSRYAINCLQKSYLIRFWLLQMGVESHVVDAILHSDLSKQKETSSTISSTVQNLTTIDADGVVGLNRMDRFHRLLEENVSGDRVGKHFIPKTKDGNVYWSENFNMSYSTVHSEPFRPVATTALSRLLTERVYLLQFPQKLRGSETDSCHKKVQYGKHKILKSMYDHVFLSAPSSQSAQMSAIESISPLYISSSSKSLPTIQTDSALQVNNISNFNVRTTLTIGVGKEMTNAALALVDLGNSIQDSDEGIGGNNEEKNNQDRDSPSQEISQHRHCLPNNNNNNVNSNQESNSPRTNNLATQDELKGHSDIIVDESNSLYSSAKMQAVENCVGRHFEGVADALVEMVFGFYESYVDMIDTNVPDKSDQLEDKNAANNNNFRNFEEYYFRTFNHHPNDSRVKASKSAKKCNKRNCGKRSISEISPTSADEDLDWEHVIECAQTISAENKSITNSHCTEIHPNLPRLKLSPSLLRRVRSRAISLFNSSTKSFVPSADDKIDLTLLPQYPGAM